MPVDSAIAFQLDLARLDADTRARVAPIIESLQRELVSMVAAGPINKRRVASLLKEAQAAIDAAYSEAHAVTAVTTDALPAVAASAAIRSLDLGLPPGIDATSPDTLPLAARTLIEGAALGDWFARQGDDTAWRFVQAVRQGFINGETNQQIIARIAGRAGFPGVMQISQRNAAALVQTAVSSVANAARMATFEANRDLVVRYRWLTALDGHVCPRCAARADRTWRASDKAAIGHGIAWAVPPIHFNDRCVIVPETKTWRELGVDIPEPPPGMRASRNGPVPATTTFAEWLKRQPASVADDALGAGRADMWRSGRITLQDLVNGQGRPLTLVQLQKKYG